MFQEPYIFSATPVILVRMHTFSGSREQGTVENDCTCTCTVLLLVMSLQEKYYKCILYCTLLYMV
jgi:hypothetical protein